MMHEAPATPRRKSASSDELDYADANKYDDLEEAQQLLAAENGEKIKKKAPPRNLFGFYLQYFAVGVVRGGARIKRSLRPQVLSAVQRPHERERE